MTERSHPCVGWDEHLSALIDGELEAEVRAEVEAHAASCARCGAQLDVLRAVDARLAEIPLPDVAGRLSLPRILGEAAVSTDSDRESPPAPGARVGAGSRPRTAPPRPEPRRAGWKSSPLMRIAAAAGVVLAFFWLLQRDRESIRSPGDASPPIASSPELPQAPSAPIAVEHEIASPLAAASDEELALALELDTAENFEVIANLELLERLVDLGLVDPEEGRG